MKSAERSPTGAALTKLIPDLLGLNNRILAAGDLLVAELGLTSARWQILGAIVAAEHPKTVAWLARDIGGHRQNVQRIVNDLKKDKLVELSPNPNHLRAPLVMMTRKGSKAFNAAMQLQSAWVNKLAEGLTVEDADKAHKVIKKLWIRYEIQSN
jgi:DNA-binding MarR family transcriptional regulator